MKYSIQISWNPTLVFAGEEPVSVLTWPVRAVLLGGDGHYGHFLPDSAYLGILSSHLGRPRLGQGGISEFFAQLMQQQSVSGDMIKRDLPLLKRARGLFNLPGSDRNTEKNKESFSCNPCIFILP